LASPFVCQAFEWVSEQSAKEIQGERRLLHLKEMGITWHGSKRSEQKGWLSNIGEKQTNFQK